MYSDLLIRGAEEGNIQYIKTAIQKDVDLQYYKVTKKKIFFNI